MELLETHELACRVAGVPRGIVPANTESLTVAMDLGKYLDHWIVVAWSAGPYGHVVDYGRIEVPSDDLGVEQATMVALRQFGAMVLEGWPLGVVGGETLKPHLTFIDAGYMTDVVKTEEFISGKGMVTKWDRKCKQNDWFDALYNACAIHQQDGFLHEYVRQRENIYHHERSTRVPVKNELPTNAKPSSLGSSIEPL